MTHEIVPHTNNRSEEIADYFNQEERLADATMRRDYFASLDETDFIDLVQKTAGLVRDGNVISQSFDGDKVNLMGHEVPDQREKEELLRKTWLVAKEFLNNTDLSDQEALDYAALTAAGGLLYAHPFADGNGRTSRVLSYVIALGKIHKNDLSEILNETAGGKNWQVTPIPIVESGRSNFEGNQPSEILWEDSFAGEAEDALGGEIANSIYKDAIIRTFIDRHAEEVFKNNARQISADEKGNTILRGEDFIFSLVNDPESGMSNAHDLINIMRELRADYVERFLMAMQSKEPVMPRNIRPIDLNITDKDKGYWLNRKQTIIKTFGSLAIDGKLTPAQQQLIQHRASSKIRH
jgi:hypothetical protein